MASARSNPLAKWIANFAAAAAPRGMREAATTEVLNPAPRSARHGEDPVGPVSQTRCSMRQPSSFSRPTEPASRAAWFPVST